MSCSKPLSYPNYAPILLNMAADQRIRFVLHCPAVQTIDKLVPLKIELLILKPLEYQINNTIYDIDFVRWNHVSKTSQLVSNVVDRNCVSRMDLHQKEKMIETFLNLVEYNYCSSGRIEHPFPELRNVVGRKEEIYRSDLLEVREQLDMVRPLDHIDYLRLSVMNEESIRLDCAHSAPEVMEHLLQQLFGTRVVIYVSELLITPLINEEMKRKVNGLRMPPVFGLLEKFNFQVNQLKLVNHHLQVNSSILQKVQRLTVPSLSIEDMEKLKVKHVHFFYNILHFLSYAAQWSGENLLTRWTCDFYSWNYGEVQHMFKHLPQEQRVTARENPETSGTEFPQRMVIQPETGTSEMHVYCERTNGDEWMLVLSVVTK